MKRTLILTSLLAGMALLATACHHHGHRRHIRPVQKHYIEAGPKPAKPGHRPPPPPPRRTSAPPPAPRF